MKFCWLFTRKFIYCGSERVTSVGNLVYRKQLHFKMYFYSLVLCFDRFHSVYKAALSRINWMYFKTTDLLFTSLMPPVFFSRLLLSLLSNTISFKSNLLHFGRHWSTVSNSDQSLYLSLSDYPWLILILQKTLLYSLAEGMCGHAAQLTLED